MLLATVLLLIIAGLLSDRNRPAGRPPAAVEQGDAALYRAIDTRMTQGEGYYSATASEQRIRGYPLRPFVAMRMPTRAWIFRAGGASGAQHLLQLLAVLTGLATALRLRRVVRSLPLWAAASLLAATSITPLTNPVVALWPETWAGLLVALSLACRTDRHWHASVLLGLLAVIFRELALAYLVAMTIAALIERRRTEAIAWIMAGLIAGAAIIGHAIAVHAILLPDDPTSQGWMRASGWGFDLSMARATTMLMTVPAPVSAVLAPLALFGWAATEGGYARRVTLAFLAWLVPFLVIGRPENSYWGLLMAPLWLAGLPLALPALSTALRPRANRHSAHAGLQTVVSCASGAHVPKVRCAPGHPKPPFSTPPELNVDRP
ncbi:hypothetical protein [Sphingobium sp.]|uniref:hypothetical protein n=1 Tax=Sphingobium sp. TaxID=1912891 RepID=UPI002ED0A3CE